MVFYSKNCSDLPWKKPVLFKGYFFVRRYWRISHISKQGNILFSLNMKIWILVTESDSEIEDVLKFEKLEACKRKKAAFDWQGLP